MINPLIFYMNTSDYADILAELKNIPCDKLIVHYLPYPHPHEQARNYFLAHEEYTHLIVMAHDVLVKKENYDKLIGLAEEYDIIAAVCNVEREGHPAFFKLNACVNIPNLDKTKRYYNWIPKNAASGIVKVEFQGNAFTIISRKIIERRDIEGNYLFKGTTHRDNNQFSATPDLIMAHALKKMGIAQYVDLNNQILHYANHLASKVGTINGKIELIKYVK